jgi:hypothetical protein
LLLEPKLLEPKLLELKLLPELYPDPAEENPESIDPKLLFPLEKLEPPPPDPKLLFWFP